MTKECVLVKETEPAVSMNCSTSTGIEKGAVLKMTDGMVAILADGDTDIVAGIAQSEVLSTNSGKIAVYRRGIFRGYAGAAGVIFGEAIITDVGTGAANELVKADNQSEQLMGIAFETAADGNQFIFELNPRAIQLT